jgi:hypothetical protein
MTDELKAATVAPSPWDQATLSINGNKVERGTAPVLLSGQENVVTVEASPAIARALNLADEVEALIDGEAVPDFGLSFKSGEGRTVTLKIKDNSPLAGLPLQLNFSTIEGDDLQFTSEPDFCVPQTDYEWSVRGVSGTGTFQLSLKGDGIIGTLDLPICWIRPDTENDLMIFMFDGRVVTEREVISIPSPESEHTIRLLPNKIHPEKIWTFLNPGSRFVTTPSERIPVAVDPIDGATWRIANKGWRPQDAIVFVYGDPKGHWEYVGALYF